MAHQAKIPSLPEPEAFLTWAKRSIADLNMRPANFLLDEGVPGSVNRLNKIIKNPQSLRLNIARRLHREIREAAAERGVVLLPLELENPQVGIDQ